MLVSRFNPLLYCVILKDKTLYVWRDGWPNLPYSSQAIEVKNEKALIEISLPVWLIFPYTWWRPPYKLFQLAAIFNVKELHLFGVALALVAPWF